ncbi:MAG: hypothetical protein ACHQ1G_03350 [Planctomycetota bacterium]
MAARLLFAALVVLACIAVAQEETKPVVVELKDGTRVVGRVVEAECTDDILVVRQFRGDAKATIPWDRIKERQAHELRVEYGFEVKEAAQGALMMQGHEIRNNAGVRFKGLWMNEKTAKADGVYILKTAEGERRIPAGDIRNGPDPVELSQLDVYTTKELYDRKLGEVNASRTGGDQALTAEDHYQLAEFAILIDALEEAKFHYESAIALNDPKYTREKLERRLTQVEHLLKQSGARDGLKEIQRALFDRKYDRATALITAFKEKYAGDATLGRAVTAFEEKVKQEREDYYVGIVPGRLRDAVKDALEAKVKEAKELTLSTAQEYAGGEPSSEKSAAHDAVAKVAADLGLTTEDVLDFWKKRKRLNVYKGFYRDGTFIVLENVEDALSKAPKPPKPGQGQQAIKLPAPTKQMTPDEWWKHKVNQKKYGDLRDWLFAYWAEKGKMCDLIGPKDEACPVCFSKGYTSTMINTPQGAVPFYNRCQSCYMAKFQRVVRFK